MLLKQKNPSLPKKLVLGTFDELLAMFSTMINLLHLLYLTTQRCCDSDKAKFSAKDFTDNSNLDDLDISLPVFSSTSNVKLYNNETWSIKASGPDCIPVVVLKNSEPELSTY